ncbi:HD domain-containing protein [Ensifer aridi]|uniref:HD domain-containing protein n=1 Tax=Ensifer aridi TaxID=1708715 RepID=UPI000A0FD56E|nr:HD domain-containing protein [Ensifer aridi]
MILCNWSVDFLHDRQRDLTRIDRVGRQNRDVAVIVGVSRDAGRLSVPRTVQRRRDFEASSPISRTSRKATGELWIAVDRLSTEWLAPVEKRLADISSGEDPTLRRKLINDPVWKSIELYDHEVLLLDSPLIQRRRGVRQLGLANLVFPGANHDRFEHLCGVVESADRMFHALKSNRVSRPKGKHPLPDFTDSDLKLVRLAALLHDVGHGPFSHAIEPVVEKRYREDFAAFSRLTKEHVHLDSKIAPAEAISALIVLSDAMGRILGSRKFVLGIDDIKDVQWRIAVLILGARSARQEACFSAIISIDADKLDYMARDAHHTGMPIAFDTDRLIRKLEVVQCTPDNIPSGTTHQRNIEFARQSENSRYSDIAVVSSGVGALEQMLIGRAFLYDRLYHHHKVRAADAMAQRLIRYAEEERGQHFELDELYISVGDDTMIRILGGELKHDKIAGGGDEAARLSEAITRRDLYHRAFAFRASFHHSLEAETSETSARAAIWSPMSTDLSSMAERQKLEREIFDKAKLFAKSIKDPVAITAGEALRPSEVIVDLSDNRVKPVSINVHVGDDVLEQPNLFFDPSRWSNVYDLQKRTGYVFAPLEAVQIVNLAATVLFFEKWGYTGGEKGRRFIRSGAYRQEWVGDLHDAGLIDAFLKDVLSDRSVIRSYLRADEVHLPGEWENEDPTLAGTIANDLRDYLPQGLSEEDRVAVAVGIRELASFVKMWNTDSSLTKSNPDEHELQLELLRHLRSRGVTASEGTELAGGETDVIIDNRCLIENKIGAGKSPFKSKADAPYQANRYGVALCQRVFFTLVAYTPSSEADLLRQTDSVKVIQLDNLNRTAVEIRFVVPVGLSNPSRAKKPKNADAIEDRVNESAK